ncbi:family 20 glycosylhydrolase, partial [Pseudomonas aeruginosa]
EFTDLQRLGMEYGVNVIPEIDIPAHSLAFTHYKPEIGSDKYGMDHLDLYKEETYRFVDSLLDEYLSGEKPVFIGPDVHIGTDEYNAKEAEKFRDFTDRYLKYVEKYGKNVRMWGALRWLKGNTPVKADNVTINAWSYDWIDPNASLKDGYKIINTCDA